MVSGESPWGRLETDASAASFGNVTSRDETQLHQWSIVLAGTGGSERLGEQTTMADQTREEVDAKLSAVEARLDAKLSGMDADIKIISNTLFQINVNIDEVRRESRAARVTMIVTGIAVAVAIIAAVWQMQSGLLQAFQIGLSANSLASGTSVASPSRPE